MTTIIGQTPPRKALEDLLGSAARVAVLAALVTDPTRAYYQRQLEAATGQPIRAVQRELERLMGAGLLYRRVEGRRVYYQVDREAALYRELRALVLAGLGGVQRLRGRLAVDRAVRLAFLSGGGGRALVVLHEDCAGREAVALEGIEVETWTSARFREALQGRSPGLACFLLEGCDLLGRRDDVVWRHIEAAGYRVRKGDGVP